MDSPYKLPWQLHWAHWESLKLMQKLLDAFASPFIVVHLTISSAASSRVICTRIATRRLLQWQACQYTTMGSPCWSNGRPIACTVGLGPWNCRFRPQPEPVSEPAPLPEPEPAPLPSPTSPTPPAPKPMRKPGSEPRICSVYNSTGQCVWDCPDFHCSSLGASSSPRPSPHPSRPFQSRTLLAQLLANAT